MEKIFSKVDPDVLLHIIIRKKDFLSGRQEIIPTDNFLQCCTLNLPKGHTFKPHKHIWKQRSEQVIAQESWIVLKGKVRCIFYDLDDTPIAAPILKAGDASFTLQGGHNYVILEDETRVLEYKTGPYFGQKLDKTFI